MALMLGNLSIDEMESRLGIDFPDDLREFMKESHQSSADNVKPGKWHCFDIPFSLVCGDRETAERIFNALKPQIGEIKKPLQIGINTKNNASE